MRSAASSIPTERRTVAGRDAEQLQPLGAESDVRREHGIRKDGLDSTEAGRQVPELQLLDEAIDRRLSAAQVERDHHAEVGHLAVREFMIFVAGESRDSTRAKPWDAAARRRQWQQHCGRRAPHAVARSLIRATTNTRSRDRDSRRSESSARGRGPSIFSDPASTPAVRSLCPPRYFVAECMTMSAPSASGFCKTGVAKVLSTTTHALWR